MVRKLTRVKRIVGVCSLPYQTPGIQHSTLRMHALIVLRNIITVPFVICSYLYQIAHLGDDDDEPEFSSAMPLEEGDTFFFAPRPLRNLVLVDELESLCPILSCQVADLAAEETPQLYMLCGRGPRSSLRVLRHGLEVSEMAVSELPANPNAVWTVKRRSDGK